MIKPDVRAAVLKRAHRCCEDCGEKLRLELHHLRYEPEGTMQDPVPDVVDGWETPDDLDALCRDCHHSRHIDINGDFWRDPREMEVYWATYWEHSGKDD